ncbi:hypothetical protein SAMD00019534_040570 [Acytostelium subglobosum LB1]|uniref:hypothetical protein n=1 Tax=Acytostelium subglobosum LB1 TaxID=1410327 RepID=UPI000644D32F|nr:hypothetical protein SAMD00019534_040570 [Acytostelium subglobosum LB1]GAM20882.1 hypothetical protein SAMD00019534_040570 [Acytostelium subglobosum LB1]|eukprot:XP_012756016.1 hypothetical protein SAMD00019534_040570 [Acytostelium subglobosum LB1]
MNSPSKLQQQAQQQQQHLITAEERLLLDSIGDEDEDDDNHDLSNNSDDNIDTSHDNDVDPIERELRRKMLSMLTSSTGQGINSDNAKHHQQARPNLLKKHQHQHQQQQQQQEHVMHNNSTSLSNTINSSKSKSVGGSSRAGNNIRSNNSSNINNYDGLSDADDTFVCCEGQRIAQMALDNKWVVVANNCVLKEYKLYAVEEWIFKSSRLWSAVEYTGNQNDEIKVSVVKAGPSANASQIKALQSMLSKAPSGSFYTIRTKMGQLVLANSSVSSHFGLNLIPIEKGDFDSHIDTLKLNLSLKRLGCTRPKYQLSTTLLDVYEKSRFEALAGTAVTNLMTVTSFVKEIQAALSHLNYLPLLTKIDGIYDQKTINAVKAFQIDYNKRNASDILQVEGNIDIPTFKGIVTEIMTLKKKIESLGFKTPDNPIKNYMEFNELMKNFQDSYGIYPDAPGKNILTYLENVSKHATFYHDNDNDDDNMSEKSEKSLVDSTNSFSESEGSSGDVIMPASPLQLKRPSAITNASTPTSDYSRHSSPMPPNNSSSSPLFSSSPIVQSQNYPLVRSTKGLILDYHQHQQPSPPSHQPTLVHHQPPQSQQQHQQHPQQHPQHGHMPGAIHVEQPHHPQQQQPFFTEEMYDDYETPEDAEEKQKLRETIVKLEKMMDTQQAEYDRLKKEFEELNDNYVELREQSRRSIAIVSTNERIFQETHHRWSRTFHKELPEIEEKINQNVDTIQSYSNRIKRLEDIVISVQKKNERNVFTVLSSSLLSIVSLIAVGFAYLIMFFHGLKRKWYPSSKPKSSSEEIQRFISNQKLKVSELIEDLDDNDKDQTEDVVNDKIQ